MSFYPSAEDLLSDARLRLDGLGADLGILFVEGPDDKRLFAPFAERMTQVVPAGRRCMLAAYETFSDDDRRKIIVLADCDYDVASGTIKGDSNLILTMTADVEGDLLLIGAMRGVVTELVPAALVSDDAFDDAVRQIVERSIALAEPLGRLRQAARQRAMRVDELHLRLHHYRDHETGEVDEAHLLRAAVQAMRCGANEGRAIFDVALAGTRDMRVCNGHDLVRAIECVLHRDHAVPVERARATSSLLRAGLTSEAFNSWAVVHRIRAWEATSGRRILRA